MKNQIYISAIVDSIDDMQIKADYFQVNGMIRMARLAGFIDSKLTRELRELADKKLCELDRED